MRRREFVAWTAMTAAVSVARSAHAQADARSPVAKRIAIVHPSEPPEGLTINGRRAYKTYFGELNRLGYAEGRNLIVERYSALGQLDRYTDVARAAVATHPDVIISFGPVTRWLKSVTATIPILATASDPVALGIVTSLAKPGRNITGVSVDAGLELYGKRLQFLSETVQNLTNVRLLIPASSLKVSETILALLRETAGLAANMVNPAVLGEKLDRAAFERAFDAMEKDRVDGLMVADAAEHLTHRQLIIDLASKHRLPAVYPYREFIEVGGLLSYGVDTADLMRRLADMTDEVLRGERPDGIPFYQQTKFELVLNRATERALGLNFPASLLAIADEVIE